MGFVWSMVVQARDRVMMIKGTDEFRWYRVYPLQHSEYIIQHTFSHHIQQYLSKQNFSYHIQHTNYIIQYEIIITYNTMHYICSS